MRLGQPEGGPLAAVGDARQVALLLLVRSGDEQGTGGEAGEQQHEGGGVGVLGHLLDGQGQTQDPRARAAELHRHAQAQEPGVPEDLEQVLRVLARFVDLTSPGPHLVLGQPAHGGLQVRQLLGQLEVHGRRLPVRHMAPPRTGGGDT